MPSTDNREDQDQQEVKGYDKKLNHMAVAMHALPTTRKQSKVELGHNILRLQDKVTGTLKEAVDKLPRHGEFSFPLYCVIAALDELGGNRRVPRLRKGFGGPQRGRQAAHQGRTYRGKAGSAQQESFPRREVMFFD